MDAISDQGRSAMNLLLVFALVTGWACFERAPNVTRTAVQVVDGLNRLATYDESLGDPFAGLSGPAEERFSQYRHLFEYTTQQYVPEAMPEKTAEMSRATLAEFAELGALFDMSGQTPDSADDSLRAAAYRLTYRDLRDAWTQVLSWHQQSGLGEAATLDEIEAALRPRVQVPGSNQTLDLDRCLLFMAVLLVGLHVYLCSLLVTLNSSADRCLSDGARSWVVFHASSLGRYLAILWAISPTAMWIFRQILQPLGERQRWPSLGLLALAMPLIASCACLVYLIHTVRRDLLSNAQQTTTQTERPRRAA